VIIKDLKASMMNLVKLFRHQFSCYSHFILRGVINVSTTLFSFRACSFIRRAKEGGHFLSKLALEKLCITLYVLRLVTLKPSLQHEVMKWIQK